MAAAPGELEVLLHGDMEVLGRLPWSSNATFLVRAACGGSELLGVYKPHRGERPLWDFPAGLGRREVAAHELSEALGWGLVPLTVLRDGPMGEGSVQRFIHCDQEIHYFSMLEEDDPAVLAQLRAVCCFDLMANNTDRKAGHCLLDPDGKVWAIDNGLAFHAEPKLRTVIWEFAGEPIPERLRADAAALADAGLPPTLHDLLDPFERDALVTRARALSRTEVFPADQTGRRYPWPPV